MRLPHCSLFNALLSVAAVPVHRRDGAGRRRTSSVLLKRGTRLDKSAENYVKRSAN